MSRTKTSSALELFLPLDRDDPRPLHRQLEQGLRDAVRDGRLAAEADLPSSRALAGQLGVSRGIVVEAYEQLVAEGYLTSRPGGSTRVAREAGVAPVRLPRPHAPAFDVDFGPGRPELDLFPRAAWLRSVRRVLEEAPSERFWYLGGRGVPELRVALAAYLDRVRGTSAHPDDIVISAGFAQGLALVAGVLRAQGKRRMGMEDPSHPESRDLIRDAGLTVVPIPVDESGIRIDRLAEADVEAVVVTPAHQYPTGAVLPPDRRSALAAWARSRRAIVIEDDYDAEFRYDRQPVGAMQGLCPERVVYAGTASKVLAPGLRLGWLVVPGDLVDLVAQAKVAADLGSPAIDQLAFADFLARGEHDRHLRRMRPIYRKRRDTLLAALARYLPELEPVGASAGLHLLAWLPDHIDEAAFSAAAADVGVRVDGLGERRIEPGGRGGVIFGYGGVSEADIEEGLRRVGPAIEALRRGRSRPRRRGAARRACRR
jgi:GntR family transcriptional regulator/MocR family aminotransferase